MNRCGLISAFALGLVISSNAWAQDPPAPTVEESASAAPVADAAASVEQSTSVSAAPATTTSSAPKVADAAAQPILVPEGTEMVIEVVEALSSKSANPGDQFTVRLVEPVELGGGQVIPAGYLGRGEVVSARPSGRVGRAGELNVRLNHLRIGEQRIPLRSNRSQEGKGRGGTSVALAVVVSPLFLLMKGKNVDIPTGYRLTGYVDNNIRLTPPLAPAPQP